MDNEFIVPTSNKSATFTRPTIRQGLYAARLIEVKMKDKDGKLFEKTNAKFDSKTNYAILEFAIHKAVEDGASADSYDVGDAVTIKIDHGTQEVLLSQFVNWRYAKTDDKGNVTYTSGISPGKDGKGSMAAKTFQALGWAGPDGNALNMQSFIGKWAGALVVDHTNTAGETFSVIQNLIPWKGSTPQETTGKPQVVSEDVFAQNDEYTTRVNALKEQLKQENITQRGYDIAVANLQAQYKK